VLFLTKLKAISSIQKDYEFYKQDFEIQIINYESIHKLDNNNFDLIICDESHSLATFPKPNNKFKEIKKRFSNKKFILLS
jgi:superfamily II DNA or RNA helicase